VETLGFLCDASVRTVIVARKCLFCESISIGKAIPLQACTDPEGSRRLRLPDFKTIGT